MDVHCMCTLLANDRAIAGEYKKEVHIKYGVVSLMRNPGGSHWG